MTFDYPGLLVSTFAVPLAPFSLALLPLPMPNAQCEHANAQFPMPNSLYTS
ncbi:MAG: hypothetical protein F6J93_24640 [Oscillatoria sp. SIO1A7]|nr:hypothetical protein [Oscillatoria sp. SIO1A7]